MSDTKENGVKRGSSIKRELLTIIAVSLIFMSFLLTAVNTGYSSLTTRKTLRETMTETAGIASAHVSQYLESQKSLALAIASRVSANYGEEISKPFAEADIDYLVGKINGIANAYGFSLIFAIDANGMARTKTHTDFEALSDPPSYYTAIAKQGKESFISDVSIDNATLGGYVINFSAPIRDESDKYIGMLVCKIDADKLSELVAGIGVGQKGSTFIIDGNGYCTAHQDADMLFGGSTFLSVVGDDRYRSLNQLFESMGREKTGYTFYEYNGTRLAAYTAIEGTEWSVAVTVDEDEFMQITRQSIASACVIAAAALAVTMTIGFIIINRITKHINVVTVRMEALANGDLHSEFVEDNGTDEISRLNTAAKNLVGELRHSIDNANEVLTKMADGDLTVKVDGKLYPGDLAAMKNAIDRNIAGLSVIIGQISVSADEVSRGSTQIADSATNLAQGAAEQSSSVEELNNTVNELTSRTKRITNVHRSDTIDTEEVTDEQAESYMDGDSTLIEKLLFAMQCIEERLEAISRISDTIKQISSETGMLALNASVEASHAGEYGRGFAVIANEIRSLSEKSREEAHNTEKQIYSVRRAVSRGNSTVTDVVESIREMSEAFSAVESTLSQISGVIENTAATVEESAAGSEELSAQADALRELVAYFKYNEQQQKEDNE